MTYNFIVDELDIKCTNSRKIIYTDSVEYHYAKFEFPEEWDDYDKTIVFKNTKTHICISMRLNEENTCIIPWEVIKDSGDLIVAVEFINGTVDAWTKMKCPIMIIRSDKCPNTEGHTDPTPDIYEQIVTEQQAIRTRLTDVETDLDNKGDNLEYTDNILSLKSGERVLSSVEIRGGGGGTSYTAGDFISIIENKISAINFKPLYLDSVLPAIDTGIYQITGIAEQFKQIQFDKGAYVDVYVNDILMIKHISTLEYSATLISQDDVYFIKRLIDGNYESVKLSEQYSLNNTITDLDELFADFLENPTQYLTQFVTDEELSTTLSNYYTKTETDTEISNLRSELEDYEQITDQAIENKQDKLTDSQLDKINNAIDEVFADNKYQTIVNKVQEITDSNKSDEDKYASLLALSTYIDQKITDIQISSIPNVTYKGTPTIQGYQVSNFSSTNYLLMPTVIDLNLPFEINFCFTTNDVSESSQYLIDSNYGLAFAITSYGKFNVKMSSNGTSWNIGEGDGLHTVQPNTTYFVKLTWNGTEYNVLYTNNKELPIEEWTVDKTIVSSQTLYPTQIYLGNSIELDKAFRGSIDFKYCNVQLVRQSLPNVVLWDGMGKEGLLTKADVNLGNITSVGIQRIKDIIQPMIENGLIHYITINENNPNMLDYITENGIYQFNVMGDAVQSYWNTSEGLMLSNGDIYVINEYNEEDLTKGFVFYSSGIPTYITFDGDVFDSFDTTYILDGEISDNSTWSSSKINTELDTKAPKDIIVDDESKVTDDTLLLYNPEESQTVEIYTKDEVDEKIETVDSVAYQSDEPTDSNKKVWINPDEDNELTIDEDITDTDGNVNQGIATSSAVKNYVDTNERNYYNGDTIQLVNNSYYYSTDTITSLVLEYPADSFICSIVITTGDTAPDGVFPEGTTFVNDTLVFEANKTYEINIMNSSVAWGEVVNE